MSVASDSASNVAASTEGAKLAFAKGLQQELAPFVDELDSALRGVLTSQAGLGGRVESILQAVQQMETSYPSHSGELSQYARRLEALKSRIGALGPTLSVINDRLDGIYKRHNLAAAVAHNTSASASASAGASDGTGAGGGAGAASAGSAGEAGHADGASAGADDGSASASKASDDGAAAAGASGDSEGGEK